ncbi:eukaryotic aspartyl protease family protein [Striga asiatica]|uniref:Eukaryotic aspartyl protease family protein n=1 Tax=Striga asiatica TaxID=4170 RepID=A0A5A7Q3K6_STRAF|nr:eukaryotic aspartyl protease family protein [Striga asiatica]
MKNNQSNKGENWGSLSENEFDAVVEVKVIDRQVLGLGSILSPVSSGHSLDTANYIVTTGLGTPQTKLSLILDTTSDLTWTQCQPCVVGCHNQTGPIFDPDKSTSYSAIPCNSTYCSAHTPTYQKGGSSTNKSSYGLINVYGSVTTGFLSKDKLTIAPNHTGSYFGLAPGVLGLAILLQTTEELSPTASLPLSPPPKAFSPLDAFQTLYPVNSSQICLAFRSFPRDYAIFANYQKATFEVMYDVADQKVGFRPSMCT